MVADITTAHWLELVTSSGPVTQRDSGVVGAFWRFEEDPQATAWKWVGHGSWEVLGGGRVDITSRLIGGCIETLDGIAGTAYGDVARFGEEHGPLLVYLEASGSSAFDICCALHHLRLSGWFDAATGVLVGRTDAPDDWRDILRRERLRASRPHPRSVSTFRLQ